MAARPDDRRASGLGDDGDVHDVIGIVDPRSGPGGRGRDDGSWTVTIPLAAWRLDGGPVVHRTLDVTEDGLRQEDVRGRMDRAPLGAVVRLRVRITTVTDTGQPSAARLVAPVAPAPVDVEMERARAELLRPIVAEHARGRFTDDRTGVGFRGTIAWAGTPTTLTLMVDEVDGAGILLDRIGPWLDRSDEVDAACRRCAADRLRETVNEGWLEDGAAPLTAVEMASRLVVGEVVVTDDHGFEVEYGDDGMFWGHAVVVSGPVAGEPDDAQVVG